MAENSINTLLVEDHEITRLGMRTMLEQIEKVCIVAEVGSGRAAVNKALEFHPDLILMDIGLPEMDGIEATRLIKEAMPAKVIMVTSHDTDEDILAGLTAGADAYCLKGISGAQLANAIQSVMDGAIWLDPGIARQLIQIIAHKPMTKTGASTARQSNQFQLSEREYQVLCLLVDGLSNQQMAEKLFLSAETVKTHMRHLMEKLSVSDRTQAAVKAVREGLVPHKK